MPKLLFTKTQDKKIRKLYLAGESSDVIARLYNLKYEQPILNSLKRTKTTRRKNPKISPNCPRKQTMTGVKYIKGYKHILMPQHHLARSSDGYVPHHRLIMEQKLGRKLKPEEVVNHIDGDSYNNNPSNLEVFKNNGEHIKHHITGFQRNKSGRFINKEKKHG